MLLNLPSSGFVSPELFQSNSASGTISDGAFVGCRMDGFGSVEDLTEVEVLVNEGFIGSMGLKLKLAAKRGMLDEADDEFHCGPSI